MIICGLKLTHDGAVALIEDGKLIFNIEIEKINNNLRYSSLEDTGYIEEILRKHDYSVNSVDQFIIDGWGGYNSDELAIQPRLQIGDKYNILSAKNKGNEYYLNIAQYQERSLKHDILEEWNFEGLLINNYKLSYTSCLHVTSHVLSAYLTSPFSRENEDSYILIWDGGMYPTLYYFNAIEMKVDNLGPIFFLIGNIYTIFSQHFGPFKVQGNFAKDDLSIAGKVMAYIGIGKVCKELFSYFEKIYISSYTNPMGFANVFAKEFKKMINEKNYKDEDILCSFHAYLEEMLIFKLQKKIKRVNKKSKNICLAGGCALNIKWNSAIRNSGLFNHVYVPPFPNDSGSALGAACMGVLKKENKSSIEWNVYSGPDVIQNQPANGWNQKPYSVKQLAHLLHETDEPIVLLHGKAELGPRALGNRSIIAAATSVHMKNRLNLIKNREDYRPVSPICLATKAKEIFEPGIEDPYMLFDHQVKSDWLSKIPAVCHIDGTARLQTVKWESNKVVADLLEIYANISGIPLLCNTSANYNGTGFFPDVYSATNWNKVNYVWCDQILYERDKKIIFSE